jgi:hypothetical protein
MRFLEWLLEIKMVMVEVASTLSFGMFLVWLLRKEFRHLFGPRPFLRHRQTSSPGALHAKDSEKGQI